MAYYVEVEGFESPEIVGLALVKTHLKIEEDFTDDDVLIQSYIDTAVSYIENHLGYAVAKQQYLVSAESFTEVLISSLQKVISIDKIEYKDIGGVLKTYDAEKCKISIVDKFEIKLSFLEDQFPEVQASKSDAVQLTLTVGLKRVKKQIHQAIMLLVGDYYEFISNRPKSQNDTVLSLLSTLRKPC